MSDSDETITHVFDQTNGVLDGFEGEPDESSEAATAGAAERRGDAAAGDRAARPESDEDVAAATRSSEDTEPGRDAATDDDEHTYAVDSGGTATDVDDRGNAAPSGLGAHVAAVAVTEQDSSSSGGSSRVPEVAETGARSSQPQHATEPTTVQRSEVADPPADHDHAGHDRDRGSAPVVDDGASGAAATTGLGSLGGDDSIGHVFDQTNGVVEGVEGESDGTAEGDEASAGDRRGLDEPNPVGQQDAWHDDHYGTDDGRDENP